MNVLYTLILLIAESPTWLLFAHCKVKMERPELQNECCCQQNLELMLIAGHDSFEIKLSQVSKPLCQHIGHSPPQDCCSVKSSGHRHGHRVQW